MTLEKEKALEQVKVKDSTINSQADQIDELTRLRKDLEKSLKDLKIGADAAYKEYTSARTQHAKTVEDMKKMLANKDAEINELRSVNNNTANKLSQALNEAQKFKMMAEKAHEAEGHIEKILKEKQTELSSSEKGRKLAEEKLINVVDENEQIKQDNMDLKTIVEAEQEKVRSIYTDCKEREQTNFKLQQDIRNLKIENTKIITEAGEAKSIKDKANVKIQKLNSDLSTQESLNSTMNREYEKALVDKGVAVKEKEHLNMRCAELQGRN